MHRRACLLLTLLGVMLTPPATLAVERDKSTRGGFEHRAGAFYGNGPEYYRDGGDPGRYRGRTDHRVHSDYRDRRGYRSRRDDDHYRDRYRDDRLRNERGDSAYFGTTPYGYRSPNSYEDHSRSRDDYYDSRPDDFHGFERRQYNPKYLGRDLYRERDEGLDRRHRSRESLVPPEMERGRR